MVELATTIGDAWLLTQSRQNLACFRQFIDREDGDLGAWRGIAGARYDQTACFQARGMLGTLSPGDAPLVAVRRQLTDTAGWPHQLYVRSSTCATGGGWWGTRCSASTTCSLAGCRATRSLSARTTCDIREVERTWRYFPTTTRSRRCSNRATSRFRCPTTACPTGCCCLERRVHEPARPGLLLGERRGLPQVRSEPTLMALGEAAGVAAALAALEASAVQEVDVQRLQGALRDGLQRPVPRASASGESRPRLPGRASAAP